MADASPAQNLYEETTCPICLEYFKDPVIVDCGHIFCQNCITQCWDESDTDASCPQCREPCQQRNTRPIRQLANIVEIAKKFSLQVARGAQVSENMCENHQEPLKLFCENDQILICVVCDKSKEHKEHKVIPKEEAFEEYKSKIWDHVEFLKKEKETISSYKTRVETESQALLEKTDAERKKIVAKFKELREYLDEQEQLLLTKLQDLDEEIQSIRNEKTTKLSEEISSFERIIKEMEEKHNQPENEFLQDIKRNMERCQKEILVSLDSDAFPPPLMPRITWFAEIHDSFHVAINKFKDTVFAGPQQNKATTTKDMPIPTLILSTEDSSAAHQQLPVSTTNWQTPVRQFQTQVTSWNSLQNQTQVTSWNSFQNRLCSWSSVMGVERIMSGSHSWVVDVGAMKVWAVGVAKESVRHYRSSSHNQGLWAICISHNGTYSAFSSSKMFLKSYPYSSEQALVSSLSGTQNHFRKNLPKRIRVSLNYEGRSVTFVDCADNATIHTFLNVSFSGEEISSWFSVGKCAN